MLSAESRAQLCVVPVSRQHLMKKVTFGKTIYRETTEELCRDRVPLNPDTQLGAFGPGADPTRSRAAYPPPRLAVILFIYCCWRPGSRLGVLEARLGVLEAGLGVLEAGLGVLDAGPWASWKPDWAS